MFIGHYAAALAADAAEPRAPLWTTVLACQLMDVLWAILVIAGVERFSFDPALAGSPLVLSFMPFTHSLPGALVIAATAAAAGRLALRLPWRAAALVGAVVFSHWLLDLLVHRPDLLLWPDGPKVGLAAWDHAVPEATLEMGLIAVAGAAWAIARRGRGFAAWPTVLFLAGLLAVQLISELMPSSGSSTGFAVTALIVYLALAAWAGFLGRGAKPIAEQAINAVGSPGADRLTAEAAAQRRRADAGEAALSSVRDRLDALETELYVARSDQQRAAVSAAEAQAALAAVTGKAPAG